MLAAVAAASLSGCSSERGPASQCRTPGEMVAFSAVGGGRLGYEASGRAGSMRADAGFVGQLNAWAKDWASLSGYGRITELWSYGAFTDKCGSWHQVGRAFDIARVKHGRRLVSCRFDAWQPGSRQQLRDYWRLAASLHLHFAYTLCYPYDAAHANHIHIDNSISGTALSTFDSGSRVQVQLVQQACRHVHGVDAPSTEVFDDVTRDAVRAVQRTRGLSRPLADAEGWRSFLRATAKG